MFRALVLVSYMPFFSDSPVTERCFRSQILVIVLVLPVWPTMPYLLLVTLLRLEPLHTRPTTSHLLLSPLTLAMPIPLGLTLLWMQGAVAAVSFLNLSYSFPILPNSNSNYNSTFA